MAAGVQWEVMRPTVGTTAHGPRRAGWPGHA